jgi:DNA-directed RNA polymerase specialized sigma24 family protein
MIMPTPAPSEGGKFFDALRFELESRARMLLAGQRRYREGALSPDDLVQEAMSRILSNYDETSLRERPHNQLMALVWRTMRNIVIDASRKKAALLEDPRPDDSGDASSSRVLASRADDAQASPEEALLGDRRQAAVQAQLGLLSPEERCFISTVLETDSVPAAQKKCGWPPKSPYYVLKKLLERLRGALEEWAT